MKVLRCHDSKTLAIFSDTVLIESIIGGYETPTANLIAAGLSDESVADSVSNAGVAAMEKAAESGNTKGSFYL